MEFGLSFWVKHIWEYEKMSAVENIWTCDGLSNKQLLFHEAVSLEKLIIT